MPGNEFRFQQVMNQGHSAAWEQLWDRAAAFYRMALEEFPNHTQALTSLGLALYQMMDYREALKCYLKAIQTAPGDPLPLEKSGELYERLNELDNATEMYMRAGDQYARARETSKALENWARVTRLNPEHLVAHTRLALVYEHLGRNHQAAIEYLAVASLKQQSGDIPTAAQAVARAIQLEPGNKEALQAQALLRSGQPLPRPTRARGSTGRLGVAQAAKPRETAGEEIEKDEEDVDPIMEARQVALGELAALIFEQGEDEQADQVGRRGLQAIMQGAASVVGSKSTDHNKLVLHLSQAIDLQSSGKDAQAIEELEGAIEAGLEHPAAAFVLGLLMVNTGRLESAARHLQRAVKRPHYELGARLLLGQIMQKMGRIQEAAVEYLEALKVADARVVPAEQSTALAQLYEPVIEAQLRQPVEALERLSANIVDLLLRKNWQEHLKQARQQFQPQDGEAPVTPLAEMLTEARGSQVVESITRIHQLAKAGFYRAAMEEAFYALQHAPTYLPLHIRMGDLLLQQGRANVAIDKYRVVAQSYSIRGEARQAIHMYRKILEISPMDMDIRAKLIDQLTSLGQAEEAIKEYLRLADAYYNQADLINARYTYAQALRVAQQTNADRIWKVKTLYRMADIDMQSLDWRQALRVFEQIRKLEPDDDKARDSLIDLNFRLGQNSQALAEVDNYAAFLWNNQQKEAAVKFMERMVAEYPKQILLRRRLAELYRQQGRIAEAIQQLDTAGDMLIEAGDRAGAIEMVMAILALNPPNVAEYQRALAKLRAG